MGNEVLVRLLLDGKAFEGGLKDAQASVDKAAGGISKAWASINKVADYTAAGIVTAGGLAIKAASDYDTAFTAVEQGANATAKELDGIKASLLDLSTHVPESANQLADVAAVMLDLGVAASRVVDVTRDVEDFGAATGQAGNVAAEQLGHLAVQLHEPTDRVGLLGSAIVGLGDAFSLNEGKIVAMTDGLAVSARAAGYTKEQTLALSASLVKAGVDAENGGAAMSTALASMADAVATGGDRLTAFASISGMTADEFKQKFQTDAAGATQAFLAGLKDIQANGGNVQASLNDVGLGGQRTRDSLLKAAESTDTYSKALGVATKAGGDLSSLHEEAAKKYEKNGAQTSMMRNEVTKLGIEVGQRLLPAVRDLMKDFLVPAIQFLSEHKTLVFTLAGAIMGLVAAVKTANVAYGVYKLVVATAAAYTALQEGATWGAVAAQYGLNAALLANPITWIVLGIIALIAIVWTLVANWDRVVAALGVAWDTLKAVFQAGVDFVVGVLRGIWDFAVGMFAGIFDAITGAFQTAWDFVAGLWTGLGEFFGGVFEAAKLVWDTVTDIIKKPFQAAWDWIGSIFGGLKDFFQGIIDDVKTVWQAVFDWFAEKFGWLKDAIDWTVDAAGKIGDAAHDAASAVGGAVGGGNIGNLVGKAQAIAGGLKQPVPHLAVGGYVQDDGLAMLHRGETVVPARVTSPWTAARGGANVNIHAGAFVLQSVNPDYDADRLIQRVALGLRDLGIGGT